MENSQILFEMLKKVDEKLDCHTDSLARLETQVVINTDDLKFHIKRTELLEEQVELNKKSLESRLDVLEQPGLAKQFLSNKIVQYSGIAAAIYGLINFLKLVKSLL